MRRQLRRRHHGHDEICAALEDDDPNVIDEVQIEISLGRIARRRNAAKSRVRRPTA